MTFPFKPGPPAGGFRPAPPPSYRPAPPVNRPAPPTDAATPSADSPAQADGHTPEAPAPHATPEAFAEATGQIVQETGHPAVDAVLRSLENAARLAPGEQIAEYEAAHQVLQETLASIDR
jgi:hypothetical protein